MNMKRVTGMITDVLIKFDLKDRFDALYGDQNPYETDLEQIAESLGIAKQDLEMGFTPIPDRIYRQYPLFELLSSWELACCIGSSPYAPFRMLNAIFGKYSTLEDIPTQAEEDEMRKASVRARCDQKVLRINELFPDAYPLELPVRRFQFTTNGFISFEKVREMSDSFDAVVRRFSNLFFAAIQGDLSEAAACELNLLATFLHATDMIMPSRQITYRHIQKYRAQMRADGYSQLESYVRIRRVIPFWQAREFYDDAEYFITYAETHAYVKEKIRRFLSVVTSYECKYTFIKDMDAHLRIQKTLEAESSEADAYMCFDASDDDLDQIYIFSDPILVPKEGSELNETDRLIVERGQALLKRTLREYVPCVPAGEDWLARMKRRIEADVLSSPEAGSMVLPDAFNTAEEGDDRA